ncbi:MAG: class I SAM-dependent methyltransferase [Eubacteriaceae bacterium]|nr:class I SAM-dependent methyltransferase [Eubacteriaceae bacterium]
MAIYSLLAYDYDLLVYEHDYDVWFEKLKLLSGVPNLKRKVVLDLGCGTGEMLRRFYLEGAQVWGVDVSSDMLAIADSKFKRRAAKRFFNVDMSSFVCSQKFDFIYSMSDSVNYLEAKSISPLLENVWQMLAPGSVFAFDVLNIEFFTDENFASTIYADERIEVEDGFFNFVRLVSDDRATLKTTVSVKTASGTFAEEHLQYLHSDEMIAKTAREAGFTGVDSYEFYTGFPSGVPEKTQFKLTR